MSLKDFFALNTRFKKIAFIAIAILFIFLWLTNLIIPFTPKGGILGEGIFCLGGIDPVTDKWVDRECFYKSGMPSNAFTDLLFTVTEFPIVGILFGYLVICTISYIKKNYIKNKRLS